VERRCLSSISKEYPLTCGSEALIYPTLDGFYKEFDSMTPYESLKCKEEMLLYLEELEELKKYYPAIKYLVDSPETKTICGYVMEPIISNDKKCDNFRDEIEDGGRLKSTHMSVKKLLSSLHELRNILKIFRDNGLLYLDIRHPNVKLDDSSNPILLDIDSITYLDNPRMNKMPSDLARYFSYSGRLDAKAQTFMFNIFTLEAFGYKLCSQLDFDKTGAKIVESKNMLGQYVPSPEISEEYLIDHVKGLHR